MCFMVVGPISVFFWDPVYYHLVILPILYSIISQVHLSHTFRYLVHHTGLNCQNCSPDSPA